MTTFFYGYLFPGLPGANPQKIVPHAPHNTKCAGFLVHAVYNFFTAIYLFSFPGQKYETRKKCFFTSFIFYFLTPRKLVNSFAIFHFFLRLFISRGARQLVKKKGYGS